MGEKEIMKQVAWFLGFFLSIQIRVTNTEIPTQNDMVILCGHYKDELRLLQKSYLPIILQGV